MAEVTLKNSTDIFQVLAIAIAILKLNFQKVYMAKGASHK